MYEDKINMIIEFAKDPLHHQIPVLNEDFAYMLAEAAAEKAGMTYLPITVVNIETLESDLMSRCDDPHSLYEVKVLRNYGKDSVEMEKIQHAVISAVDNNGVAIVLTAVSQYDVPCSIIRQYDPESEQVIDVVPDKVIDELIKSDSFDKKYISQIIIKIGEESLDPTNTYQALIGELMNPRKGRCEFYVKDSGEKWIPDPRIIKLGKYIDSKGGFSAMQEIYQLVMSEYKGGESNLGKAWAGIGEWRY